LIRWWGDDTEEDLVAKLLIDNAMLICGYLADFFTYFDTIIRCFKGFEMPSVYDVSIVFAGISLYEEEKVDLPEYFAYLFQESCNDILTYSWILYLSSIRCRRELRRRSRSRRWWWCWSRYQSIRKMVEGNLEILEDAIGVIVEWPKMILLLSKDFEMNWNSISMQ